MEDGRETRVWDGYGMPPFIDSNMKGFKQSLNDWIEQISEDRDTSSPEWEEVLYWELGDWFDDNVCADALVYKDQKEFFSVRMKVTLNTDGTFVIEEPTENPDWQIS